MNIRWPPSPLGLGTPLNLALTSSRTREQFKRSWWLPLGMGLFVPLLMLAIDQVLFGGVSMQRVRELGSQPLPIRLLIVVYSGVTEELIYRLFAATTAAWLAYAILSRFQSHPKSLSQWIGIVIGAVLFGLAHVANLPDVAHPVLRAVTINGVAGLFLGWLYWWHGLESAILTHMAAIVVLYIVIPLFL